MRPNNAAAAVNLERAAADNVYLESCSPGRGASGGGRKGNGADPDVELSALPRVDRCNAGTSGRRMCVGPRPCSICCADSFDKRGSRGRELGLALAEGHYSIRA